MGQARNGTGMKWVPFELFIMNKARFGMGPKWVRTEMEQSGPKWDGPDMGRAPNGQARNGRPEMVRPEMAGPEMGYTHAYHYRKSKGPKKKFGRVCVGTHVFPKVSKEVLGGSVSL